eukprot:5689789-Pleurochrysis_carterae.AAC.1
MMRICVQYFERDAVARGHMRIICLSFTDFRRVVTSQSSVNASPYGKSVERQTVTLDWVPCVRNSIAAELIMDAGMSAKWLRVVAAVFGNKVVTSLKFRLRQNYYVSPNLQRSCTLLTSHCHGGQRGCCWGAVLAPATGYPCEARSTWRGARLYNLAQVLT